MVLDHELPDVYHLALDVLVFADGVIEALQRFLAGAVILPISERFGSDRRTVQVMTPRGRGLLGQKE